MPALVPADFVVVALIIKVLTGADMAFLTDQVSPDLNE
jgi:hypothetical protein